MGCITEIVLSAMILALAGSIAAQAAGMKTDHGNRVLVVSKMKSVHIVKRPDHVMLNPQPLPPKYKFRLSRGSRYPRPN
jgi:hypothetical protein